MRRLSKRLVRDNYSRGKFEIVILESSYELIFGCALKHSATVYNDLKHKKI